MRVRDVIFTSLMATVIGFFLVVFAFSFKGDTPVEGQTGPTHQEIFYPANARPLDLQCGDKPCVIFADPDSGKIVALMPDGSTITIRPEEDHNY